MPVTPAKLRHKIERVDSEPELQNLDFVKIKDYLRELMKKDKPSELKIEEDISTNVRVEIFSDYNSDI